MKNSWLIHFAAIIGAVCVYVGCGSGAGKSALGKVTGTVTFQGKPVDDSQIVFHNPNGRSATGQIVAGAIEDVTTYDVLNDGAPVGTLKVTVHPLTMSYSNNPIRSGTAPPRIRNAKYPARYGIPETSGLEAIIKPGTNELTFELTENEVATQK
ncbi:MAG: hypothetical protein JWM11_3995 [Planctomycetaceae bacterium]|nr:hypothetical protein [Planctomycetaceae bacterium]